MEKEREEGRGWREGGRGWGGEKGREGGGGGGERGREEMDGNVTLFFILSDSIGMIGTCML